MSITYYCKDEIFFAASVFLIRCITHKNFMISRRLNVADRSAFIKSNQLTLQLTGDDHNQRIAKNQEANNAEL